MKGKCGLWGFPLKLYFIMCLPLSCESFNWWRSKRQEGLKKSRNRSRNTERKRLTGLIEIKLFSWLLLKPWKAVLWTAARVSAQASTRSSDESFKSILPLQNLHRSNSHYRTSVPNKTLTGNAAWNSHEIYSAKNPLHGCTPFSTLVMTQTSVLMLKIL